MNQRAAVDVKFPVTRKARNAERPEPCFSKQPRWIAIGLKFHPTMRVVRQVSSSTRERGQSGNEPEIVVDALFVGGPKRDHR